MVLNQFSVYQIRREIRLNQSAVSCFCNSTLSERAKVNIESVSKSLLELFKASQLKTKYIKDQTNFGKL